MLLLGGGMPLLVDGDVIGGIGVAGSGGAANDERCATQAIAQALTSTSVRQGLNVTGE
ncbi:heme-binding protein [Novosphingobium lindaniclasticum]|uniref:heme-binding protein n=1 Tax=Novosphingobium lindaniclasticum TaxID=1329895 RepID=UPI000403DFE1|nr:heme-binding protein [Novosphingobium lindaniclasticum]